MLNCIYTTQFIMIHDKAYYILCFTKNVKKYEYSLFYTRQFKEQLMR